MKAVSDLTAKQEEMGERQKVNLKLHGMHAEVAVKDNNDSCAGSCYTHRGTYKIGLHNSGCKH